MNLYLKVLTWCLHSKCLHCIRWQRALLSAQDSLQLSDIQIQSWTTLQQNFELPQPQGCLGYSDSVPIDLVPNRPISALLHPPRRQQGAISRVFFSSASPVLCQMSFDLLSPLGPLSRIWQETSLLQQQSMHLNRILDNVAPGTAVKYVSSCMSFLKTSKVLQMDLTSLTDVQFGRHSNHNVIVKIYIAWQ